MNDQLWCYLRGVSLDRTANAIDYRKVQSPVCTLWRGKAAYVSGLLMSAMVTDDLYRSNSNCWPISFAARRAPDQRTGCCRINDGRWSSSVVSVVLVGLQILSCRHRCRRLSGAWVAGAGAWVPSKMLALPRRNMKSLEVAQVRRG